MGDQKKGQEREDYVQPEIREFVRKAPEEEPERGPRPWQRVAVLLLAMASAALGGILWLGMPILTVAAVIVLEGLLGMCLHRTPVWLHVLTVACNVAIGGFFGMPWFMLLGCIVYLAVIAAMHRREE